MPNNLESFSNLSSCKKTPNQYTPLRDTSDSTKPKSVFISTNFIIGTGGGNVSLHEKRALESVTNLEEVLTQADIDPTRHKLHDIPFLWDYLAAYALNSHKVDLAFFNGSPFGLTSKMLKPAKIIVDIPAHNLETSVEEFQRARLNYPFIHMTDPLLWNIYSQHIKNADVVLCPSLMSAKYITEKLSLKSKVVVIPHGCFLPKSGAIKEKSNFKILHVGVNGIDKGQVYLVDAWLQLKDKENFSGSLVLIGHGTEHWKSFGAITYPHVNNISDAYTECSIYVQPSVTEGFGLPVLEAMAHGIPVIVTRGAGVSEIVEDGKEGFLVPIRSPEAIADKIRYFNENPEEIARMGKNARKKGENYSWDIIEKKYQKMIEECLYEKN